MKGTMSASMLLSLMLIIGWAPGLAHADDCPTWDQMVEEESVSQVIISNRRFVGLSMSFVYLNPPELGRCVLGEELYQQLERGLLKDGSETHVFWVGVGGTYVDLFRAERIYMVQGDKRFDLSLKGEIDVTTPAGTVEGIRTQHLIMFDDAIDVAEPITIFYESGMGTYSGEYWLADKYVETRNRDN